MLSSRQKKVLKPLIFRHLGDVSGNPKEPYKLKQFQNHIFTSKSMIWLLNFVFVERVEGLRGLPVAQNLAGPLGVGNF